MLFSLEGINRANAVVNFKEPDVARAHRLRTLPRRNIRPQGDMAERRAHPRVGD